MLPVQDEFIQKALSKHKKRMSEPPKSKVLPWAEQLITSSIRKTVLEVFRRVNMEEVRFSSPLPTSGASYEVTRKDGGMFEGVLKGHVKGVDEGMGSIRGNRELLWMDYDVRQGRVLSWYTDRSLFSDLRGAARWCGSSEKVRCKVHPILEPCKVRTITMGEALPYWNAISFNRMVYSQIGHHPTFRLLSRPLQVGDLEGFQARLLLSGDYEAATDTLDKDWSELTLALICERLGDAMMFNVLKNTLTCQRLVYPDGTEVDQENGQLMGSPSSFPILCILNAAINRLWLDPTLAKPLSLLPMLINGDDILMSHDEFDGWAEWVGQVGLKPSLGKNYISEDVACINSEFYQRLYAHGGYTYQKVKQLPVSLVYGQGRVASSEFSRRERDGGSIGSVCAELVSGQEETVQRRLLKDFIVENSQLLASTKRSWWLPMQLGGLGLPYHLCDKEIPELHRRVASWLATRPDPRDVTLYCAGDATELSEAGEKRAKEELARARVRGLHYVWLDSQHDEVTVMPSNWMHYGGYSWVPEEKARTDRYDEIVEKVRRCPLKPMSIGILDFVNRRRHAGYVLRRRTDTA